MIGFLPIYEPSSRGPHLGAAHGALQVYRLARLHTEPEYLPQLPLAARTVAALLPLRFRSIENLSDWTDAGLQPRECTGPTCSVARVTSSSAARSPADACGQSGR